ncbi:MAG: YdiU family protein [Sporocytophaga sp.]|uniref:protein adenylyltransferase SelO n=1 Tax=Sporocytophaga sp. TaxID=2231183 RepID=UPI001B2675C2|nr:YdiU family protein [Sporocytophaga sp.]MBO9702205.1 YdiU family protein [Sporocytophaga sp.]
MDSLSSKKYTKDFVDSFDGDHSGDLTSRQTPGVLYSKALPTPVKNPQLIGWSDDFAGQLGVEMPAADDVKILGGNLITPTMYPYASCYAGHQFGNWAGQLGDGRAITLGEWVTPNGESWEFQLKGAGPTPYSRRADGRAVLRSSVREFLMSEAMHYLRVPTTRALGLVTTGDMVMRDMFYNGNPQYEPGAIVMRVSPSFLRFGNFEMLAARKDITNLTRLVNWTIDRYYPHITGEDRVIRWFKEVVEKTAQLIVEWLRVGFVHGVMNTDNMSVLGLTIDYGPYSFLDNYDPEFTPNTTDLPGRRYAFGNQSSVAYWNLGCLANALVPLFETTAPLVEAVESYENIFWLKYYAMMGHKLGLDEVRDSDLDFINRFEQMLSAVEPDMTIFYQLLAELTSDKITDEVIVMHFKEAFYKELSSDAKAIFLQAIKAWRGRIEANRISREESLKVMSENNPRYILRNYILHKAIEELERGENQLFLRLQLALKNPYSRDFDEFFMKRPEWATQMAGCSMLSCSS